MDFFLFPFYTSVLQLKSNVNSLTIQTKTIFRLGKQGLGAKEAKISP